MKPEGVEEGGQAFHNEQDGDGENRPRREHEEGHEGASEARHREPHVQHHVPQHLRQL